MTQRKDNYLKLQLLSAITFLSFFGVITIYGKGIINGIIASVIVFILVLTSVYISYKIHKYNVDTIWMAYDNKDYKKAKLFWFFKDPFTYFYRRKVSKKQK